VIACVNDADETVISGPIDELARVEELAGWWEIGAQRLRLPFPGHHPMLWHEAGEFAHFARSLRLIPPRIPVYSAVAGRAYTAISGTDLGRALGACLVHPAVLPSVLRQATADARLVFEVGTGDALTRSVRRSIPGLTVYAPVAERAFPRFRSPAADRADAGLVGVGRAKGALRSTHASHSPQESRTL
jgi:acyl transferase domain-containing protein